MLSLSAQNSEHRRFNLNQFSLARLAIPSRRNTYEGGSQKAKAGILLPFTFFFFLFLPFTSAAYASSTVTVAWDKNAETDVIGYKFHYGTVSKNYQHTVDVKNNTSCSISGLAEGTRYYFAVTAYNDKNFESSLSAELAYTIPNTPPPPTPVDTDGDGLFDSETFNSYTAGSDPADWLDTAANNSMAENDSLFKVTGLNGDKVFGTTSTQTNIHSHHTDSGIDSLSAYEYIGRMMITNARGGIGVTFFSQYPNEDAYYRLRRYKSNAFHISPHGTTVKGDADTGIVPLPNVWYWFRILVEDTGTRTEILAKVWPENSAEPAGWQVDCYDKSSSRLAAGTIGVWSYYSGSKYWDDMAVDFLSP